MKASIICVFLVCLGAAMAQGPGPGPKCCIPDQWESDFGMQEGIHRIGSRRTKGFGVVMKVHYDAKNQLVASEGQLLAGVNATTIRSIVDYKKQVLYSIVNGKCKIYPNRQRFAKFCLPNKYAHYMGHTYFGLGGQKFGIESYSIPLVTPLMKGQTFVTFTPSCIPVGNSGSGISRGVEFMYAGGYTGITAGIKDRSVFTPPRNCKRAEDMDHGLSAAHYIMQTMFSEDYSDVKGPNDTY